LRQAYETEYRLVISSFMMVCPRVIRQDAAGRAGNVPALARALELRAADGEVAHLLRGVWGVYQPRESF
jgi:hypothetical protein